MFAWAILAVVMVGFFGLIIAAQPHAGSTPPSALSDAIARDCLAVFDGGSANVTLPNGLTIEATTSQCTIQAPSRLVTESVLTEAGVLIGGQWVIQGRSAGYVTQAQIAM
jgi:hypothetical protein